MATRKLNERSQNRAGRSAVKAKAPAIMVRVNYEDVEGRWWVVLVPQGHEDESHMGIPVGPPDLSPLGLPEALEIRLHNQLFQRGLLTARDIRGRAKEVFAAVQSAYQVDVAAVTGLYR